MAMGRSLHLHASTTYYPMASTAYDQQHTRCETLAVRENFKLLFLVRRRSWLPRVAMIMQLGNFASFQINTIFWASNKSGYLSNIGGIRLCCSYERSRILFQILLWQTLLSWASELTTSLSRPPAVRTAGTAVASVGQAPVEGVMQIWGEEKVNSGTTS